MTIGVQGFIDFGGDFLSREEGKKIKYSIWDTRTDERNLKNVEKSPLLKEAKHNRKNNNME
ncbi:hypothetical protein JOC48_001808 [Aquibacillus albus]|uniref:Uncharacterized protein n=1 Tax=Aquibacillus albus TaxID=1168171 RepID=A0ABS2MZL0_9BACI|nr:hypothetical protein [Aquibacillus albus]